MYMNMSMHRFQAALSGHDPRVDDVMEVYLM